MEVEETVIRGTLLGGIRVHGHVSSRQGGRLAHGTPEGPRNRPPVPTRHFWRQPTVPLALAKNPVFQPRSKHIDIQYHFTRELVQGSTGL